MEGIGLMPFLPKIFGGLNYPTVKDYRILKGCPEGLLSLMKVIASDDRILTPLDIVEANELSTIWNLEAEASPYAEDDHRVLVRFADAVNQKSMSADDMALWMEMDLREFQRFKKYKKSFIDADGRRWCSLLLAINEVKRRCIANRGLLQFVPTVEDVPSLREISKRFHAVCRRLEVDITADFHSTNWDLVNHAAQIYEKRTEQYVDVSFIDDIIPDLVKKPYHTVLA
jgi:hypothetical protein